jgi:large subunit ribosomal protein L1
MAKQKAKTVDMSVTDEDLAKIELPEEAEKRRLKELEAEEKAEKEAKKEAKKAEKDEIQEKIEAKVEENVAEGKAKKVHSRSKKYSAVRHLIDRTKTYPLAEAIALLKQTSYTKFAGSVSVDLVVKDQKVSADIAFPHATGRTVRVAIATDELLEQVNNGVIDFDVLVASPAMMPKIAKYARVLGPKGLMPNPKSQTVSADPEKRKKELEAGKITLRTEKKAPLMHVLVGKTDMDVAALEANVEALIKAVGSRRITKLVLSATMSPGIKVDLAGFQAAV